MNENYENNFEATEDIYEVTDVVELEADDSVEESNKSAAGVLTKALIFGAGVATAKLVDKVIDIAKEPAAEKWAEFKEHRAEKKAEKAAKREDKKAKKADKKAKKADKKKDQIEGTATEVTD